jgi:hypothetical protein
VTIMTIEFLLKDLMFRKITGVVKVSASSVPQASSVQSNQHTIVSNLGVSFPELIQWDSLVQKKQRYS